MSTEKYKVVQIIMLFSQQCGRRTKPNSKAFTKMQNISIVLNSKHVDI